MSTQADLPTIVAQATAAGAAGIGVLRLSGTRAFAIAQQLSQQPLPALRTAGLRKFYAADGQVIDDGLLLCFAAPASFTGEDVVEIQAHGAQVVLRQLLDRCLALGAQQAAPGEFSERAFCNGKLDLIQAEAIADLIAATHIQAAQAARRSLDGVFSQQVKAMAERLLRLRVQIEASIDFSDEPIDPLGEAAITDALLESTAQMQELIAQAQRGQRLRDGLHAVLLGPPNAGKSSLLNALAGNERAIVTDIAGTTRDLLHETVQIDGIALTLVDTAGLREGGDVIEREGMRRAARESERADLAIVVLDARQPVLSDALQQAAAQAQMQLIIHNKADLLCADAHTQGDAVLRVSAKTGEGLSQLRAQLVQLAYGQSGEAGGTFSARARHLAALQRALQHLQQATETFAYMQWELTAESLRDVDNALGELVGRTLPDALLGEVFSTFCIGK